MLQEVPLLVVKSLELTGTEFDLLCVFHKQIGTVLSRDEIGELLHGRRSGSIGSLY